MRAYVKGIGWATPAGFGQGRSAESFPLVSGELPIPSRKDVFAKVDTRFGRLDDFSRIGLAALTFCLRDAGMDQWSEKRSIGVIAASRAGCLATDRAYLETMLPDHGKLASPNLFAYTLSNSFLGEAALRHGLTGNCLVLNRRDPELAATLQYALEELCWSDQQGVLVGFCNTQSSAEILYGGLFLLLSKSVDESSCYGVLEQDRGQLTFAGRPISGLPELLRHCLELS